MAVTLPEGKFYNFFIDDNVFFFTDIAKKQYSSIFGSFYLKGLKDAHEKYGVKFTLNTFWHNAHEEFKLSEFPEKYKAEFEANSDWLKFAFHGYSEFPGYPYSREFPEKMEEHYDLLMKELDRIVGKQSLIAPVIMHYFELTDENRKFMREHGMKFFAVPKGDQMIYRPEFDQYDMPVDAILNLFKDDLAGIRGQLNKRVAEGKKLICIGSHEQYAYPFYANYIPEYFQEIDTALKVMTDNGYQSVYFNEKC